MNSLLIIIDAPFVFYSGILLPYFKIKKHQCNDNEDTILLWF